MIKVRDTAPALSESEILAVLAWAGFSPADHQPGHAVHGVCPIHTGADSITGFTAYFNSGKHGRLVCWTRNCLADSGKRGGDIFSFIGAVLDEYQARRVGMTRDALRDKSGFREQKTTLEQIIGRSVEGPAPKEEIGYHEYMMRQIDKLVQDRPTEERHLLERQLERYKHYHPYLYSRHFTKEVMDEFEVGYDPVTERITIPVRDADGHLIAIAKRVVDDSKIVTKNRAKELGLTSPNPKYTHDAYTKGDHLYNMHRVKRIISTPGVLTSYTSPGILIVEGQLDVMRLYQLGFPLAVGVGASSFSPNQGKLLEQFTDEVTILLDSDKAGEFMLKSVAEIFGRFITVYYSILPRPFKDAGEVKGEHGPNLIHYVLEQRTRA